MEHAKSPTSDQWPADRTRLSEAITARCAEMGFAGAGVATLEPSRYADAYRAWLGAGRHGEMDYLEADLEVRLNPERLLPSARSAVVVGDLYARRGDAQSSTSPAQARIARYAGVRDYHRVLKSRLHDLCDELRRRYPGARFRTVVDTAPVLERELAARAGVGWVGKHTLIINPRLGSYLFLGAVFTTLDLAPLQDQPPMPDHCGTCTRCIDACPTAAITPYSIDATRCLSYLTIEHRSPVDPAFFRGMDNWVYGCDICQDVCPHNSPRGSAAEVGQVRPEYAIAGARREIPLLQLLESGERDIRRLFRSTPMWRITGAILRRNAIIAAGNAVRRGHAELRAGLEDVAWNAREDQLVRETARAVLRDLDGAS